jgi:4-hydroxy-2-oxoglutarate aldolase
MTNLNLHGILPPVPTPFDTEGNLDLEGLARNVSLYNDTGLRGYVALGSNGEAVHLTREESDQVIKTIKTSASPGRPVIAGVNEFTSRAAIEAVKRAAGLGADAGLVITPYYYKGAMTQEALHRHYTETADKAVLPILVYNVPQNTGVVIDAATIASLSSHQNIVGVKDSAGNMAAIAETVRLSSEGFSVMVGNGGIVYPSLMMGAAGAVLAVACAFPDTCVALYNAVKSGDHAKARDLQNRLAPVAQVVTAGFGVAGLKAAMEMNGFVGGATRSPLIPVTEAQREKIKATLRDSGLVPGLE